MKIECFPLFYLAFFSPDTTKSKSHCIKVDNSSDGKREIIIRGNKTKNNLSKKGKRSNSKFLSVRGYVYVKNNFS